MRRRHGRREKRNSTWVEVAVAAAVVATVAVAVSVAELGLSSQERAMVQRRSGPRQHSVVSSQEDPWWHDIHMHMHGYGTAEVVRPAHA